MLLCGFFSLGTLGQTIKADAQNANLQFSGEHAGRPFDGQFNHWQATLILPPEAEPRIEAKFSLGSAETGNAMYDETLVEEDWFNVKETPTATFYATDLSASEEGYLVNGELSLRGVTQPVSFALIRSAKGLSAKFKIDRLNFGIGKESDPDAEWVSREISLTLTIPK